jgi:hypothetical protein
MIVKPAGHLPLASGSTWRSCPGIGGVGGVTGVVGDVGGVIGVVGGGRGAPASFVTTEPPSVCGAM